MLSDTSRLSKTSQSGKAFDEQLEKRSVLYFSHAIIYLVISAGSNLVQEGNRGQVVPACKHCSDWITHIIVHSQKNES